MEKVEFTNARALIAVKKYSIAQSTLKRWEKIGEMPAKYAGVETKGFKINNQTLLNLRLKKYPTQDSFLKDFNAKYNLETTRVNLSNWERGKNTPSKVYQNYLIDFFK